MNLRRIRLTLTLWYVAVLLVIVVVMGVTAYVVLSRTLSSEVDSSLKSSAMRLADQVRDQPRSLQPASQLSDGRNGRDGRGDSDHDYEYLTGASGDVFYAILGPDGAVLANPLNVDLTKLAAGDGVAKARDNGTAWRNVKSGDVEYRLLFYATRRNNAIASVVVAGRSLDPLHNDLTNLAIVLLATSAGGLAFAVFGGLYVSGRALRPASEAYNKQRGFISDASHELRTPLTLIRASAEAIQRGRKSTIAEEDIEALGDILSESDRMSELVEDLLTLAKLDENRLPLRRADFNLADLLEEAGRRARILDGDRKLSITVDAPPDLTAHADLAAIQRVVSILVDNAIRYAGESGTLQIRGRIVGSSVEVSVSDSGPGLKPEDLKLIFERFYRTDQSRSKDTGGSGLGLSIARGIVEAHGGQISAESAPGRGATFRFTVPAQE